MRNGQDSNQCLKPAVQVGENLLKTLGPGHARPHRLQAQADLIVPSGFDVGEKSPSSTDRSNRMRASVKRCSAGNSRASLASSESILMGSNYFLTVDCPENKRLVKSAIFYHDRS